MKRCRESPVTRISVMDRHPANWRHSSRYLFTIDDHSHAALIMRWFRITYLNFLCVRVRYTRCRLLRFSVQSQVNSITSCVMIHGELFFFCLPKETQQPQNTEKAVVRVAVGMVQFYVYLFYISCAEVAREIRRTWNLLSSDHVFLWKSFSEVYPSDQVIQVFLVIHYCLRDWEQFISVVLTKKEIITQPK